MIQAGHIYMTRFSAGYASYHVSRENDLRVNLHLQATSPNLAQNIEIQPNDSGCPSA
ncbi:hypothetical protein EC2021H102_00460 [Escherichia coli]